MKKSMMILWCSICLCTTGFAQEAALTPADKAEQQWLMLDDAVKKIQHVKVSGYVQSQYQWGEKDASLKVGTANENPDEPFSRIGIRRGRIKLICEEGVASGVFQLDLTDKGLGIKDAYLMVKEPWFGTNALKAGIFDRPFGNEISYSSSRRESPERSTICQTLFPEERDLGVSFTLQAAKTSPWYFLKLEAGWFAGNGIKQETDSRRDFIGHLSAYKNIGNTFQVSGGVSYYHGSVFQGSENVYTMQDKTFVLNSSPDNKGKFAKREYVGIDGQFSMMSLLGITQLRAEYLFGEQPGGQLNSKSPNASVLPSADTYIRNLSGGYILFIQDLGELPLSAVLKKDWYDPNTRIAGHDIGQNHTTVGDLAQNTFGLGLLWRINTHLRLQAYYEINKTETTENLANYAKDADDDVFTLRLQYKF